MTLSDLFTSIYLQVGSFFQAANKVSKESTLSSINAFNNFSVLGWSLKTRKSFLGKHKHLPNHYHMLKR